MKVAVYEPIIGKVDIKPYTPKFDITLKEQPIVEDRDYLDVKHVTQPLSNFNWIMYQPSNTIISKIKEFEGFKPNVYKDTKQIDTIGYGSTAKDIVSKGKITEKEAESYLLKDINDRIKDLERYPFWKKLKDNQKDALLSLHYNIGSGKFKNSSKLINALNNEDWVSAAKEMDHGINDKLNPGLKSRRLWEQKLFLS